MLPLLRIRAILPFPHLDEVQNRYDVKWLMISARVTRLAILPLHYSVHASADGSRHCQFVIDPCT